MVTPMNVRLVLPALLLLSLLPAAAARPLPDIDNGDHTVGPCRVAWGTGLDSQYTLVVCIVEGQEVLYYWDATTLMGHSCAFRVAGQTIQQCDDGSW